MEWDTRIWSFFIWLIATVVFAVGLSTPFDMFGNRHDIPIAYGGDVRPGGVRYGVWGEVPEDLESTFMAIRVLLCISAGLAFVNFVGYILLFKRRQTTSQILTFVTEIAAGLCAVVASGVYRGASDQMGEGFWMCCMSGTLYLMNGIVLIFMPIMEYQTPKWKRTNADSPPHQVELLKMTERTPDDVEEKAGHD